MTTRAVRVADLPPAAAPPTTRARTAAAIELGLLIGGVLAIMWLVPLTPWPRAGYAVLLGALVGLLVVAHVRERPGGRELGLRFDNFLPVLRRLAPIVAGFVVVLVAIGLFAGSLRFGPKFWSMLATVPPWALLQQYLLLGFVHRRFRLLLGPGRRAIGATTALFGLMHLPNPGLTIACTLGGYVWAREFERSPNLLAHALSHAVGSAFLANTLPRALLKNMVVGYRYLGL